MTKKEFDDLQTDLIVLLKNIETMERQVNETTYAIFEAKQKACLLKMDIDRERFRHK